MKKYIYIAFLLVLSQVSFAQTNCEQGKELSLAEIQKIVDQSLIKDIAEKNDDSFLTAATLHLDKIKDTKTFDQKIAEAYIQKLRMLSESLQLNYKVRSQSLLLLSGYIGRIADAKQSAQLGKESYGLLKKALYMDKDNRHAKQAFASAVVQFIEKNAVVRKFIEMGISIRVQDEASEAIKVIEAASLQNDPKFKPLYEKIKKFKK